MDVSHPVGLDGPPQRLHHAPAPATVDPERLLAARQAALAALAGAEPLHVVEQVVVEALCRALGWPFGELWVLADEPDTLTRSAVWHDGEPALEALAMVARSLSPGVGFPGRAFAAGQPVWQVANGDESLAALADGVGPVALRSAVAAPVLLGTEVRGVLALYSRERVPADAGLVLALSVVAAQLGQFRERHRAVERWRQAARDLEQSHEDLRTTQVRLVEATKMESVGRLAANVAHEVKNPLAVVSLGLAFLEGHPALQDPELRDVVHDMGEAVARADGVVRGLLDFARPQALESTQQDLNAVIRKTLTLIRFQAAKARVTPQAQLSADLPFARLDEGKLTQVLVNVMLNAIEAMPDGGTMTVRSYGRGAGSGVASGATEVVCEVEDDGCGVPLENLGRVFDPFFTSHAAGRGTGLGLTICKQLVELHGGRIGIENRIEGGARVTIALRV